MSCDIFILNECISASVIYIYIYIASYHYTEMFAVLKFHVIKIVM